MKERPILFTGEMANAILDGRKTQTRRVIKNIGDAIYNDFLSWDRTEDFKRKLRAQGYFGFSPKFSKNTSAFAKKCPYGLPGDRLWVRETWRLVDVNGVKAVDGVRFATVQYKGFSVRDYDPEWRSYIEPLVLKENNWTPSAIGHNYGPWKPSIHMPRWASRITLEVTGVRVERLQTISDADAVAEGLIRLKASGRYVVRQGEQHVGLADTCAKNTYARLWESINGPGSWDANPWVWVVSFKQI